MPLNTPSPEQWAAVRRGERDAMGRLCRDWLPTTLQWCRRLGGPRVDPEAATQEVFLVVLRRVSSVRHPEQFPSWLFSVTRRVLAQHRRRAWGLRWDANYNAEHVASEPDPAQRASQAQVTERVHQLIQALPEALREVLVLCDIEERTDAEAAALLGVPPGTVKSRLRSARVQFRQAAQRTGLAPDVPRSEAG